MVGQLREHGFGGNWLMHEESISIPLVSVDPREKSVSRTSEAMALNLDIGPTLLAAAGQPVPTAMQGRSLLPCLSAGVMALS